MNSKKLKKAVSISLLLLVAFFAQKWFEDAYKQPSDYRKLFMLFVSLIVLVIILYINTDEKGNF